jgi:anti-anti-sigma factor
MEVFQASLSGVPMLRVVGDIDHNTSATFDAAVMKSVALGQGRLLLDLAACPYIDSGGLAVILDAVGAVRGGGWVGVISPNANVSRILRMVGLLADESFVIFADDNQAAKHIDASGRQDSSPFSS